MRLPAEFWDLIGMKRVNDNANNARIELMYLIESTPDVSVEEGIFIADHLIANDVVPVVRCGNCCLTQHSPYALCVWCDKHHKTMKQTDFCSYGERREGE